LEIIKRKNKPVAYRRQILHLTGNACLYEGATDFCVWEYARKGDYHRKLDPNWSYTPTYLRKMNHIRRFLSGLPKKVSILDAAVAKKFW